MKSDQTHKAEIDNQINAYLDSVLEVIKTPQQIDRPYANVVLVKMPKHEGSNLPRPQKIDYIEQKFVLTHETTFTQLLKECCAFWGVPQAQFQLFGHKHENLMSLNSDPLHPAHRVSHYFQILRLRYPSLHLLRPNTEKAQLNPTQKAASLIHAEWSKEQLRQTKDYDLLSQQKQMEETQDRNFKMFVDKYPHQAPYNSRNTKETEKFDRINDPDTYFQTLLVNILLLTVTIIPIFLLKNFSADYFTLTHAKDLFDSENILLADRHNIQISNVHSPDDFR